MARLIISRRRQHINIYNGHRHGIDEKKKKNEKKVVRHINSLCEFETHEIMDVL
jgi:hypothetical protein